MSALDIFDGLVMDPRTLPALTPEEAWWLNSFDQSDWLVPIMNLNVERSCQWPCEYQRYCTEDRMCVIEYEAYQAAPLVWEGDNA